MQLDQCNRELNALDETLGVVVRFSDTLRQYKSKLDNLDPESKLHAEAIGHFRDAERHATRLAERDFNASIEKLAALLPA